MIGEPDYIFFIMDKAKNGKFYGIGPAGNLTLSTTPYPLRYSPSGWQDVSIQNVLNMRYFGADRSVSVPLDFVEDGAEILKSILYKDGPEAKKAYLFMARYQVDYTNGVLQPYYKHVFTGEVDFGTFNHDGPKFNVKLVEQGLVKFLRANEKTVYEIPMDVPAAIRVKDDGISLEERLNYQLGEGINYVNVRYAADFLFLSNDGDSVNIFKQGQNFEAIAGTSNGLTDYVANSTNCFMENIGPVPVNITIAGTVNCIALQNGTSPLSSSSLRVKSNATSGTTEWIIFSQTMPQGVAQAFSFSFNITVPPGGKLFMIGTTGTVNAALYRFEFLPNSNVNVTFETRYAATYPLALRPQYVFEELIQRVTGGEYMAENCAFLNRPDIRTKVLRSGDAIRGIEKPLLKLSLDQFFEWLDCRNGVAMWLNANGKVEIGEKSARIDWSNPIPLTYAGVPKFSQQNDLPFNELHVGYADPKNESGLLNAKNEFNTLLKFTCTGMQGAKTLAKVSPFGAGCYEQENIRTALRGKDSSANKNDNGVYVIAINDTLNPSDTQAGPSYYTIDRSLNQYITGVKKSATVYNASESPRRNLERLGGYLRSCHFKGNGLYFGFATADRNSDMVYNDGATVITEKAGFTLGSLATPLFTPFLITVTCVAPFDLLELLAVNPNRPFSLEIGGIVYLGLPVKEGINPSTSKEQEVQLLAAPQSDFEKLKNYNG